MPAKHHSLVGGCDLQIRVTGVDLELQNCSTRIPFRFGIHTLTEAPMAVVKLEAETSDGTALTGWSSELLVPRWFEKDPDRSVEDDIRSLVDSINCAAEIITDGTLASVFDHYWRMFEARVLSVPVTAQDRLTRGFGCAIWERAMMAVVSPSASNRSWACSASRSASARRRSARSMTSPAHSPTPLRTVKDSDEPGSR